MISPRHRISLSLAGRLLGRPRPAIWLNYLKYKRAIRRVRENGPDELAFAPPSAVIWATARCNKDCVFCHYHGELNPDDYEDWELSLERFEEIIRHAPVATAVRICLYGGEPLLNRDLFRMVRAGRRGGHLMTVNTNGLLIKDRLDELLADPPDLLSISYYPEDRAALAEAVPLVAREILVRMIFLLSKETLDAVPDVLALAAGTGVRSVCFEHLCPTDTAVDRAIDDDDPLLARLKVEMNAAYGERLAIRWPEPAPEASCRFFWNSLFVNARGQTSPCCVWPMSTYQGDLFGDDAVWNGARITELRRQMRTGDFPPHCRTCRYLYDDPLGI